MHPVAVKFEAIAYRKLSKYSLRRVATEYGVSKSVLGQWCAKRRDVSPMPLAPRACKRRKIADRVRQLMEIDPHLTAVELIREFAKDGTHVSEATISRCRKSLKLSYKVAKLSQARQPADANHPFFQGNPYHRAIAVDESRFVFSDTSRRGWAKRGQLVDTVKRMNKTSLSLILAIDSNGVVGWKTSKSAFNMASYAKFIRSLPTHRTIISDNVSFHKSDPVKDVAAHRNLDLVYTPPYSPWFNPTEFAFSKVKNAYRRARLKGSSNLVNDIRSAIGRLTPDDCSNFFSHARRCVDFELSRRVHEAAA
jgi:transposase